MSGFYGDLSSQQEEALAKVRTISHHVLSSTRFPRLWYLCETACTVHGHTSVY